jgi:hypothetical protein
MGLVDCIRGGLLTQQEATLPDAAQAALIASLLISGGAGVSQPMRPLIGVPMVVAGFAMAWSAAARARRSTAARSFAWAYFWLSANTAIALSAGPLYPAPRWYNLAYAVHPALGILLIGIVAGGGARARSVATWTAVASASVLLVVTPIAIPQPSIDVWTLTQASVKAMLHGIHPYVIVAPDTYQGAYDFGYTTMVFPYMPLDLIVNAPSVALLGDYRFGLAIAFPVTVAILRAAGRRLQVGDHTLDVATLALALQPYSPFLVAAGYIEPIMVATLALFVYVSAREMGGVASAIAFFLLPALKQYVAAPVLIFVAMKPRPRALVIGVAVAAATIAPFLVWRWHATLAGMMAIMNNMRSPAAFRTDSLSLTAVAALVSGVRVGPWLGAAAQLASGAVAFALLRRNGLAGFLVASALAVIASFLVGTQAFANYYAFGAALLLFGALAMARQDGLQQP